MASMFTPRNPVFTHLIAQLPKDAMGGKSQQPARAPVAAQQTAQPGSPDEHARKRAAVALGRDGVSVPGPAPTIDNRGVAPLTAYTRSKLGGA